MFKNSYQNGLLSIFYSCGSNPLAIWDMEVKNGHIKRLTDNEVNSIVLEIVSTNVATTFISCPKRNQVLGIKLPFLVMIVKNLKRYFSFEITVLDDKNMRRRFRISNFQSTTKIKPFCTSMPIGLSGGWNQIQFNLADFTRRAYGTQFIETLRVQVHANARIRRIYFSERLYAEEELPQDYKLYLPLERKKKGKGKKEEPAKPAPAAAPAPEAAPPPPPEPPKEEPVGKPSTVTVTPATTDAEDEKPAEVVEEKPPEAAPEAAPEAPPEETAPAENPPEEGGEAPAAESEAPEEAPAAEPPAEEAPPAEE
ncbi:cilia- and flagella-associated protein 20-like [Ostrinia nubilalis]|uniref:cilia- and flagella-associated protein 20-like n=1 Tax=Ostrinia nubilalis TaxID=29057 RepID=UPI0030823798